MTAFKNTLSLFQAEVSSELEDILHYWATCAPDISEGGFLGEIDDQNQPVSQAAKGSVLNARILWTFSRVFTLQGQEAYLLLARRCYDYFEAHFLDKIFGGVYWEVTFDGRLPQKEQERATRKQIYAQAFWIYALSEYHGATGSRQPLDQAKALFQLIEKHSYDPLYGGYYEAFNRDWSPPQDLRLSKKDQNAPKTMNTHLHLIEAYANLYRWWPDQALKEQIVHLLSLFDRYMIDPATHHLNLFFDEQWQRRSSTVSYGHDIEAAWLLLDCAQSIRLPQWIHKMKEYCGQIAAAAAEGLDRDGGLFYEQEPTSGFIREKHWWPQAEAMVGFLSAYQTTGIPLFLDRSLAVWQYIKSNIKSPAGEWLWGRTPDGEPMTGYYKAGQWKCPYHNTRACIETLRRLDQIMHSTDHPGK